MPPRSVAGSAPAEPVAPPTTPAELLSRIDAQCALLPGVSAKGQKVKAGKAYIDLEALLTLPTSNVLLRLAEVSDPASRPRWRQTFGAVADYLSAEPPAKPKDVERLEAMIGAASRAGARLAGDGSLDLLLKLTLDALCGQGRAPAVVDSGVHASPHAALISLLHTLSRDPHRGLRRLNTRRRRQLLSNLFGWVCGDERKGPHPSVLCRRGLMRRYAALLSTLVDDWPGDMEAEIPDVDGDASDGPLSELLAFFRHVVGATDQRPDETDETPPRVSPGAEALLGALWQSVAAAATKHGLNAVAEFAAFGMHRRIQDCVRECWGSGGASMHDHLTLFLRFQLAALAPCGIPSPRALDSTMRSELMSGSRLAAGWALLDASNTTEEAWQARSLLQLISTALLAPARPLAPPAKRARDAEADPLHTWLLHSLRGRADDRPRLLLLLGTATSHGWPEAEPRVALVRALLLLLPTANAPAHWPTLTLVVWCLYRLAASAPLADAVWVEVWLALLPLAGRTGDANQQLVTAHFCFQALHQVFKRELLPRAQWTEARAAAAVAAPPWLASDRPPPVLLSAAVSFCGTLCAGRGGASEESAEVLVRLLAGVAVSADPLLTPALDATRPSDCARQLAAVADVAVDAFLRAVGAGGDGGEGGDAWDVSSLELLAPSSEATSRVHASRLDTSQLDASRLDTSQLDASLDTSRLDASRLDALGAFLPPRLAQLERCVEHLEAMAAGDLAAEGPADSRDGPPCRCVAGASVGEALGGLRGVALAALDTEGERLQRGGDGMRGLSQCARLARLRAELLALGGGDTAQKHAMQRSLRLLAWHLHECLGGAASVDESRWAGAAAALAEIRSCLASLVRLVEGGVGGAMGEWAEELLSPLSPELITLVRGVTVLVGAADQAARTRHRASEAEAAAAREAAAAAAGTVAGARVVAGAGGFRDAPDLDDDMELDEADQRDVLNATRARADEGADAEPPALWLALECVRLWMILQPRTAARVAPELGAALRGRHGAAECFAVAVAACRRCETVPARPSTAGGAPGESQSRRWFALMEGSLEPAHRALASSPKQEAPLRAALRAAAAFARTAPASLPEGGTSRELAPYMRLLRAAVGACTARGGHARAALEPRTRLLLAVLMLEHLRMRVRKRVMVRDGAEEAMEMLDLDAGDDGTPQLLEALKDQQWAVRCVGLRGLRLLLQVTVDQEQPKVLAEALTAIVSPHADPEEETDAGDGVPLGVLLAFLSSDTPDETEVALLIRRRAATSAGPPAVPSPAFERHVAALLALSAAGSTSPACRDTAIALLLAAHGAGAPPPGRATLRAVSAAALRRTAEAVGAGSPVTDSPSVNTPGVNTPGVNTLGVNTPGVNTPGVAQTARLLNKHACGVLALWLRHHLPLPSLPCALFVPDTAPPLPGLVRMLRAPLFAAAVLASDRGTLHLAANTLGTDSAGALLGSLPAVLAAVLPLRHSATEEGRHNAAMAIAFVADVLVPSSLAVEAQARHADVIEALVCSAASDSAPIPPRHLLRSVYKALKSENVVGVPALALALPRLPVQRLYALILRAHAAAVAGSDVAPLELLLSHSLLGDEALRRAAVPHLLQQALLDVIATRGAGSLCDRAARLLVNLHAAMPEEVRAVLLRRMLLTCVPAAAGGSRAVSDVLASLLASPLPPPIAAALAALPPLTLGLPADGLIAVRNAQAAVRPEAEEAATLRPADEAVALVVRELDFCCRFTDAPCEVRGALLHAARLLRDPSVTSRLPAEAARRTRAWLLTLAAEPLPPPLAATAARCLGMLGPPLAPDGLRAPPSAAPTHLLAIRTLHRCLVGGAGVRVALLASDALRLAFCGTARRSAVGALRALHATGAPADNSMAFQLEPYSTGHDEAEVAPASPLDVSLWRGDGGAAWECRVVGGCLSSATDALLRVCAPVALANAHAAAALLAPALADVSRQPSAARPLARALSAVFGGRPDPSGWVGWRDATRRVVEAVVWLGGAGGAPGQPEGTHGDEVTVPPSNGVFWSELDLPVAAEAAEAVGAIASALFLHELHRARTASAGSPAPAPDSPAPDGRLVRHCGGGGCPDGLALAAADAACRGGEQVLSPLLRRGCFSLASSWLAVGSATDPEVAWRLGQWENGDAIGQAVQAVRRLNTSSELGMPAACAAAASVIGAAADASARLAMLRLGGLDAEDEEGAVVQLTALAQCEVARAAAAGLCVQAAPSASQGSRSSQGRASQGSGLLGCWRMRVDALLCVLESHGRVEAREACRRLEPLVASHVAVLQAAGAPPHETAWLWLRTARGCRRCGDAAAARAMLCRAAEGAAGSEELGAALRWQSAKLLWDMGGAARAEAVSLARGLDARLGQAGGAATPGLAALRVRVARRYGGWLDAMRWERREAVEEVLLGAQRLAEADGQTEAASAKAHFALGAFYQRQQVALAEQGASAGSLRARHERSRLESELENVRVQRALEASENPPDGACVRQAKRRRELADLELRLLRKIEHQIKHCGDDAQGAADAFKYAELAMRSFLLSLSKQRRPDAAAAAVMLWTTHPALSEAVAQQLDRGMPALDFVPFAPHLLARLGAAPPKDSPPPTDPAPPAYDDVVVRLLLRGAAEEAAGDAPLHRVPSAVLALCDTPSRRSAVAASLAAKLRCKLPGTMAAVEAVRSAHLQLAVACLRPGASPHSEAVGRLHERVPQLALAPVPGAAPGAPRLSRFEPGFRVISASARSVSVQLWCTDAAGTRHAHVLRVARRLGGFNAHAEASLAQALAEASGRCPSVLPLRHDVAVVGWVQGGVSLAAWLKIEHDAAHRAGIDSLSQAECAAALEAALGVGLSAGTGRMRSAASSSALALRRIQGATVPLLHRWLLAQAASPAAWLERREAFGRSLGAACLAGWAVGLKGRAARRLLLVGGQGGAAVVHLNVSAAEACVAGLGVGTNAAEGQAHPLGEPVPFRLTRELRDALGPRGASAPAFELSAAAALAHARRSRQSVLLILATRVAEDCGMAAALAAELAAAEVEARLSRREVEEATVAELAAEATDEERLSRMGVGWRPWL